MKLSEFVGSACIDSVDLSTACKGADRSGTRERVQLPGTAIISQPRVRGLSLNGVAGRGDSRGVHTGYMQERLME
jgi:hypothetical protein